jgi:hypothetical protein
MKRQKIKSRFLKSIFDRSFTIRSDFRNDELDDDHPVSKCLKSCFLIAIEVFLELNLSKKSLVSRVSYLSGIRCFSVFTSTLVVSAMMRRLPLTFAMSMSCFKMTDWLLGFRTVTLSSPVGPTRETLHPPKMLDRTEQNVFDFKTTCMPSISQYFLCEVQP